MSADDARRLIEILTKVENERRGGTYPHLGTTRDIERLAVQLAASGVRVSASPNSLLARLEMEREEYEPLARALCESKHTLGLWDDPTYAGRGKHRRRAKAILAALVDPREVPSRWAHLLDGHRFGDPQCSWPGAHSMSPTPAARMTRP